MKNGILALLTQGPAYGLQLRNELSRRAQREAPFNVGQVYATIDRLVTAGLVVVESQTRDGSLLYGLTEDGRATADIWLREAAPGARAPWEDMVFQVLVAHSLPGVSSASLIDSYRAYWRGIAGGEAAGSERTLRASGARLQAVAALDWLDQVAALPDEGVPVSRERPARGRPASRPGE